MLERVEEHQMEGEKGALLRGLHAMLLVTPEKQKNARSYIEGAIDYIRKN